MLWRLTPVRENALRGMPRPAARPASASVQQRVRRLVRQLVVTWVCGRVGLRVVRLPSWGLGPRRFLVYVDTLDCLRDAVTRTDVQDSAGPDGPLWSVAEQVTVVVAWWRAPWRGWSGRLGPLPGVVRQALRLPVRGRGFVIVGVRLAEAVPLHRTLAAVLPVLGPARAEPTCTVSNGQQLWVLVDDRRVNPRGRRPETYEATAPRLRLELDGRGWRGARWQWGSAGDLPWPTVTALRSVGVVECGRMPEVDPVAEASLLVGLAMAGVVVHAPRLGDRVGALVAADLREILARPPATNPLDQEIRSVQQRRAALRGHSLHAGLHSRPAPAVSAILVTKRTEYLAGILRMVATQTYPSLEIVLCLHGIDLPAECREYIDHCGRQVEVMTVPVEVNLGAALGLATGRASGSLVTKVDDDDIYGPEHVWDLVLAYHYSGATLVGKGLEFVHLAGAGVTVRRRSGQPESDAQVVAGGTMLIARGELEQLGGWRPVPRSVDLGLLERVHRAGATVYRTHPLGYLYRRRSAGHTWTTDDAFFLHEPRQRWDGLPPLAEFGTA